MLGGFECIPTDAGSHLEFLLVHLKQMLRVCKEEGRGKENEEEEEEEEKKDLRRVKRCIVYRCIVCLSLWLAPLSIHSNRF